MTLPPFMGAQQQKDVSGRQNIPLDRTLNHQKVVLTRV